MPTGEAFSSPFLSKPAGMFELVVVGNIGSSRYAQAGETSVLNVSIASSRKVREREYTDWISCKIWGTRAEKLREHLAVGMKVLVRGRPEAKGFQRNDGTVHGELVVHVADLEFLTARPRPQPEEELSLSNPPTKPKRGRAAK
jgi:single-strand DNA-binding protein